MNTQDFISRVEARREELKMPISRLCDELGAARSNYYFWLVGEKDMRLTTAMKLSQILNIPITEHDVLVLDDVNVHIHNQLLDRPEAGQMVEELLSQGMEIEDVAIAFQTGAKKITRILLNHRSNDNDTYKRKLR
jgi:predicted transcriptional regulator